MLKKDWIFMQSDEQWHSDITSQLVQKAKREKEAPTQVVDACKILL